MPGSHAINVKYLLSRHGKDMTLTKKGLDAYTYNPATGGISGGSSTDYTVTMHFSNYNLQDIDGSQVIVGDRRVLIPTEDTSGNTLPIIEIGDEISGEGDTVSIVAVQTLISGFNTICYICQVRE